MRYTLTCIIALFSCFTLLTGQGIQFEKSNWDELLSIAQKENKLIFVDAYTTWCGPCKQMSKRIFTQPKVGDYFNSKFINVKMDMEKGEGVQVAKQYDVFVYPTLLFIDGRGKLVHRAAGFHDVNQIIELGDVALNSDQSLGSLQDRFDKGDRDPAFLKEYTQIRFEAQDGSHTAIAEAYMDTQKDWLSKDNKVFIFNYTANAHSKLFDFILDNRQAFADVFGKRAVTEKVQQTIFDSIYESADKSSLEQVDELFAKAYGKQAPELSSRFRMTYYRQAGDRENYAKSAVNYLKKFPDQQADEINEIAWTFYQVIEDKKLLKKAVKWTKKSIKKDSQYYNHDTLAALYYKLGKKKKAKKAALTAIQLAKDSKQDFSETDKLLEEIYKM